MFEVYARRRGRSLFANRGLLIITHRAKTMELADRIIVLKDGKIAEEGKLKELQMKKNGELVSLMSDLD